MVKVSVLVPIYNVEKFLPECLESLVRQTLREIEIICINDGSTDRSREIVQRFAEGNKRIRVIDKKNSGYGDSMNKGLAKARGEYVGIVEADDFVEAETFERLYQIAKKGNCDVVKANYYEYFGDEGRDRGVKKLFSPGDAGRVFSPREKQGVFYQPPCIWSAIYKRSFLERNGIRFLPTPGASYQDTSFNFKVWATAKRVCLVERAFVHYRQDNAGSSVKDVGKVGYVRREYDEIERFLQQRGLLKELGWPAFNCRMGAYVWNLGRLKMGAAMKFAKVVRADYAKAVERGVLEGRAKATEKRRAWLWAARNPELYVLLRPVQRMRNKWRRRRAGAKVK